LLPPLILIVPIGIISAGFYKLNALPVTQPTASKQLERLIPDRENHPPVSVLPGPSKDS